jgi:uncharacterized peroxidase-related enzyme
MALVAFRPETGAALLQLTNVLMTDDGTLTRGERELIAAYVSRRNGCNFCRLAHGAVAGELLPDGTATVHAALADPGTAPVSDKMKALLHIAGAVQVSGQSVTSDLVAAARDAGATDLEIHDTVLIAAMFCMFNRYIDGLAAESPDDPAEYVAFGQQVAANGYSA